MFFLGQKIDFQEATKHFEQTNLVQHFGTVRPCLHFQVQFLFELMKGENVTDVIILHWSLSRHRTSMPGRLLFRPQCVSSDSKVGDSSLGLGNDFVAGSNCWDFIAILLTGQISGRLF